MSPDGTRSTWPAPAGPTGPWTLQSFLRTRGLDLVVGLGTGAFGLAESAGLTYRGSYLDLDVLLVVLLVSVSAGLFRALPGAALCLFWLAAVIQLSTGTFALQVELVAGLVAFGAARHGNATVLWLSGASLPFGMATALVVIRRFGIDTPIYLRVLRAEVVPLSLVGTSLLAVLGLPWLVGLLLRIRAKAARDQAEAEARRRRAETQRTHAQEIAALREGQARMARDVHDVVGHSLAVILVQAESAQFLSASDPAALRRTMENIAVSARQSLRDVREVLTTTSDETGPGALPSGSLDTLLDGVESAGNPLRSSVEGTPGVLRPESEAVAFRVLQEMLTNALKHGRRGEPVVVLRHWGSGLRLEVTNAVAVDADGTGGADGGEFGGSGIDGMRRRLDSVGGRLAVGHRELPGTGPAFTATAWLPR